MYVPSCAGAPLRMRTITAFTTVPCLTWLSGGSLTERGNDVAEAGFKADVAAHRQNAHQLRAPELSATVSQVRI